MPSLFVKRFFLSQLFICAFDVAFCRSLIALRSEQCLVSADAAGVMFTLNPINGGRDEIVINATLGLGEALVSGMVTPDQFTLDAATGRVRSATVGSKARVLRAAADGDGVREEAGDDVAGAETRACIGDAELAQLYLLAQRILALYGGVPQDIEWAIEGGRVQILQVRANVIRVRTRSKRSYS